MSSLKGTATDLARVVASCQAVNVAWSSEAYEEVLASAQRRVRQRAGARRRIKLVAGVGACAVAAAITWTNVSRPVQVVQSQPPVAAPLQPENQVLRFPDGSTVKLLTNNTEIRPREVNERSTNLALVSGAARFVVTAQETPHFRVQVDAVSVEVLGTVFELERLHSQTQVRVEQGVVWVSWPGGHAEVVAGQSGLFPPALPVAAHPAAHDSASDELPSQRKRAGADWRRLAQRQDFSGALELIEREPVKVRDEPEDLLLAADAARLGGKPARAVPYLQSVIRRHRSDARAPAAAFTLGRLWLESLASPAKAADAFRRAHELAPNGPLAEDARFRETEALVRAGDVAGAGRALAAYKLHHPGGRRAATLERMIAGSGAL